MGETWDSKMVGCVTKVNENDFLLREFMRTGL